MKLLGINVQKLYGTLSLNLALQSPLSLLVGINGSGKTSILNVIDWLIRPNLLKLATTTYKSLRLNFEHESTALTLEATQTDKETKIHLLGSESPMHPITIKMSRIPAAISESGDPALIGRYIGLEPEPKERPLFNFLESLPKPIVISLDRTITAETDGFTYEEPNRAERLIRSMGQNQRPSPTVSPLQKVTAVLSDRYNNYRSTVFRLNEKLKAKIVVSAFMHTIDPFDISSASTRRVATKDIDNLQKKVLEQLGATIREAGGDKQVADFFRLVKSVSERAERKGSLKQDMPDNLLLGFSRQFQQINDLAEAFDEFERRSSSAYESIRNYLEITNQFLRDSRKMLFFKDTGHLGFRFINDQGEPVGQARSIEHMSSGERQIIILLTFLAFVATRDRVFIVDEPELSLHPKWQTDFLGAFEKLAPKSTQMIIATHSPEIVAHHKNNCVVLEP